MNQNVTIFNEDCLETLKRDICYDYVITSPPDFDELGEKPDLDQWYNFLSERIWKIQPRSSLATIFVSDRRYKGETISKDVIIHNVLGDWLFLTHKIWVKSYKTNLYRPNFTHILTYANEKKHRKTPPIPDVFYDEFHAIGNYSYNFSLDIVKKFILAYTDENDVVFDPFIGSGTTALACMQTNRKCIGTELNKATFDLCNERIRNEQDATRKMVDEERSSSDTNQTPEETPACDFLGQFFGS